ncbi:hypothetical protein [Curtobacterium luteum]|uniref:hypothetical protein n=1 Tax=Curtobacterium luteum TaxID=33881 RepID=UPI003812206C
MALSVSISALVWGGTVYADSAPITNRPEPDATALTVDGTAVPFRAVSIAMARERSTVVSDSGGAESSSPDFWQTKTGNSTPAERLVDRARHDLVRLQVQLELAKESGVDAPTSYPQVLQAWQLENGRRAEALRTGKPVYGPQQFTEPDYLDYFTGNLSQATEAALVKRGSVDDSESGARRFQRAHQDRFPGSFDAIRQQVTMAYVESQYTGLVDRKIDRVSVHGTALLTDLPRYRCVADGSC